MAGYVDSEARAEDNFSSAWTLVIVGAVGLVLMILVFSGVIPFPVYGAGKYLIEGVLTLFCVVFLFSGIISFKKGKSYSNEASAEKAQKQRIIDWCKENDIANKINEAIGEQANVMPQEELYFQRSEMLKRSVFASFRDMGIEYLDHITDELYDSLFED